MSATPRGLHQTESELLDTLIQDALAQRRETHPIGRTPGSVTVVQMLNQTAHNFRNTLFVPEGDPKINKAIAEEKAVVVEWLNELIDIADGADPNGKAQIYEPWRVYCAFVEKRFEKLRPLTVEKARKFMVRQRLA